MSGWVLEFNDTGLALGDAGGLRLLSPGFAHLGQEEVITGAAALATARLHPRQTQNRFWMRLGTEPLPHPHARARHHADLAWLHLQHIHEEGGRPAELIFAVPANFSREQLGILLGIAGRCAFRAVGLVDSALAAASGIAIETTAVHLDLQLHQCVLTRLEREGKHLRRVGERVLPGLGLAQLQERWARHAATEFIRQSRFDPMHSAATEQQLYDRLPDWLGTLGEHSDVNAALHNGSNSYQAKLRAVDLLEAVRPLYQQLGEALAAEQGQLLLGSRIARLPRIGAFIGETGTVLGEDAVHQACLRHMQLIRSEDKALRFVTQLPAAESDQTTIPVVAAQPVQATRAAPVPSLLVHGARAWRLSGTTLHLAHHETRGWSLGQHSTEDAALTLSHAAGAWWVEAGNGRRVLIDGLGVTRITRAEAGASLRLPDHDDAEFRLVAEEALAVDGP